MKTTSIFILVMCFSIITALSNQIVFSNDKGDTYISNNNGKTWSKSIKDNKKIIFNNTNGMTFESNDGGKTWLTLNRNINWSIINNPVKSNVLTLKFEKTIQAEDIKILNIENFEYQVFNLIKNDINSNSLSIDLKNVYSGKYLISFKYQDIIYSKLFIKL